MVKLISLILSQIILFQSMQISIADTANLSNLIEHAQFHKENYGDSFMEFLYEHYIDQEATKTQNHKEHQDLPFKQGIKHFNHLVSVLEINPSKFELEISNRLYLKKIFFYKENYTNIEKPTVFQPPKFA